MGVLPHVNDKKPKDTAEETAKEEEKYCADLIKQWGRKAGMNKKCKTKREKLASECFYAKKARGNKWFIIRHFAGDVKYYVLFVVCVMEIHYSLRVKSYEKDSFLISYLL